MLGYGTQGRGQAMNARDNGLNVIVGLREGGGSWKAALEDGWVPGKNLFNVDEASKRGTIIMYLLSDAGQKTEWCVTGGQCSARHRTSPCAPAGLL